MPYGGNPTTDAADAIRVMVGDTDASAPRLDDGTYALIIATESNIYSRARMAAQALAGKYADQFDKRVGDLWRNAKVLYDHYSDLAKIFRMEAKRRIPATPFSGGASVTDVSARNDDDDRVKPSFEVGMQDVFRSTDPNACSSDQ